MARNAARQARGRDTGPMESKMPDHDNAPSRSSALHLYFVGLRDAASGNAHAFGFSIVITVTYGVVAAFSATPGIGELFGFALAAVAAFSLLNVLVAALTRGSKVSTESERMMLVATATDFLAVGAAIGAAYGATLIVGGWGAWVLAPFFAGLVYALVQALELAVGQRRARRD